MSENTTTKTVSVAEAFGLDIPKEITVPFLGELLPRQKGHIHDKNFLSDMLGWLKNPDGDSFAVFGPTGSGKSTGVKDVLAATGRKYMSITANGAMRFTDLVGHHTVIDGTMMFQYGPLASAMRYGLVLIINEFDLIDPDEISALNDVLEGEPLVIAANGGEVITAHENFRFIVTGNTNGSGDSTGRYSGTTVQNIAFMDRFIKTEVDYLPAEAEEKILARKAPSLPEDLRTKMVRVANEVRDLFKSEESPMDGTISTRALVRWARLTLQNEAKRSQGVPVLLYALNRSVANGCSTEGKKSMLHITKMVMGMNDDENSNSEQAPF